MGDSRKNGGVGARTPGLDHPWESLSADLRGIPARARQDGRMNSRVHPKYKTNYRVSNWAEYERGLVRRADVTVRLSPEAIAAWKPAPS